MAIPKLLEKMRHSVQDTGDQMTGSLDLENASSISLSIGNGDSNNLTITKMSAMDSVLVSAHGGIMMDSSTNNITFVGSGEGKGIISGLEDPTEADQAATKQYVDNNGGTFQAIYGTTTYEEIVTAYNQGKSITLYHSSYPTYIFDLVTIPTESNTLIFRYRDYSNFNYATTYYYYCTIDSSSTWNGIYGQTSGQVATSIYRSGATNISSSTGYYRPIRVSTAAPTSSDGNTGDIWIQYSV